MKLLLAINNTNAYLITYNSKCPLEVNTNDGGCSLPTDVYILHQLSCSSDISLNF